jgi:hypothetical protein
LFRSFAEGYDPSAAVRCSIFQSYPSDSLGALIKNSAAGFERKTIRSEQNTIGSRAGQLDLDFLLHGPADGPLSFRLSERNPDESTSVAGKARRGVSAKAFRHS